jgi:hypothetical protein
MYKASHLSLLVFIVLVSNGSRFTRAQVKEKNDPRVERGKYIVEGVAMCERCHTQRDQHGNPDRAHWLMGGPTQTQPTYSAPGWAIREPRIAGTPPGYGRGTHPVADDGNLSHGQAAQSADAAFSNVTGGRRSGTRVSQVAALKLRCFHTRFLSRNNLRNNVSTVRNTQK